MNLSRLLVPFMSLMSQRVERSRHVMYVILGRAPPVGTDMKTAKTEIADPNVNNAVVPMDIVVIKDMTMFPIC